MKLLVLGSSNMVGHVVALFFKESGHEVRGFDETKSNLIPAESGSFHELDRLADIISNGVFDAVINCTAIVNEFAEQDKEVASYINAYFPHWLEKITSCLNTVVVHRSTDCIFSGASGQYGVDAMPDATSFYAKTKVVGELVNNKDITIRTSLIGPELEADGIGLLNWFLKQNGEVKGFANAIWTGLTTIEFAREIEFLLNHRQHGLYQCVPNTAISKYELLGMFENSFPGNRSVVRICNARIDKSLVQELGDSGIVVPDYRTMVDELAKWVQDHISLYPHYYKLLGN